MHYTVFDLFLAAWMGYALAMIMTASAFGRRVGMRPLILLAIPIMWLVIRALM